MLTAIGLLPLALLGAWGIHTASGYQQREQERLMLDLARAVSSAVDAELDGVVSTLTGLGHSPALQDGDLRAFYQVATTQVKAQPDWVGIILTDGAGKILFRTMDDYGAPTGAIVDPDSLRAALSSQRPVAGRIARGVRGRAAFPVRVPVTAADGKLYTLTAVIRPDRMSRLVERQQAPGGAITAIRDGALAVVARSQNQESSVGLAPSPSLVQLMRAHGEEGVGLASTREGRI
ncbi:hypothetical protein [Duganella dendranthematis]|uniref:hypothetical protein n=1 Tax=Duganella dendranthematis TaxID=2728021 RepID=UPI001E2FD643|nr:hypothetical protein [Duganella dendranthematis]